jgi:hypothetical protein
LLLSQRLTITKHAPRSKTYTRLIDASAKAKQNENIINPNGEISVVLGTIFSLFGIYLS